MATTTIAQDRSSSPIRETISSHSLVVLARSATQPKPVAGAVCRESLRREQITCFDENPNQAGLRGPVWTSNLWRVYLRHAECKYCVVWLIQSPYTWNIWIVVLQQLLRMQKAWCDLTIHWENAEQVIDGYHMLTDLLFWSVHVRWVSFISNSTSCRRNRLSACLNWQVN